MDYETVLVSAVVGVITSAVTTYITLPLRMKEERNKLDLRIQEEREKLYLRIEEEKEKWTRDFAVKYAEKQATDIISAERIAEQFAIGVLIYKDLETGESKRFFLPSNSRLMAGRNSDNAIVIKNSSVSLKHCAFEADNSNVYIVDMVSTMGVFVNGNRVENRQKLCSGDAIVLGRENSLKFHLLN
jgi:pSer/pThr/pTyr-binding forkhead associated (FHA) protein